MRILLRGIYALLFGVIYLAFAHNVHADDSICTPKSLDEQRWVKLNAQYLSALHEPSLCKLSKPETSESYRFIWLRTFHHPVAVRIDIQRNGIAILTTKITSGRGGYSAGHIISNQQKRLTQEQTTRFLNQIDALGFWTLPSRDEPFSAGNDGAEWMIEALKKDKYHVVHRWSPKDGPVRDLGLALAIRLGGLKIPESDIY